MKLISDATRAKLEELLGFLFIGNSILDNCVYQLDVKFVMPSTSHIIHEEMAHQLPILADKISEYVGSRNEYLHRPVVPENTGEYVNIKEIFDNILEYMTDLEKMAEEAIYLAESERDRVTKVFLEKFLLDIVPYTKIALDMVDYVEMSGYTPKDNMTIDDRVNKFLGFNREEGED